MTEQKRWETEEITLAVVTNWQGWKIEMWDSRNDISIPASDLPAVIQALQEAQAFIEGAQEEI